MEMELAPSTVVAPPPPGGGATAVVPPGIKRPMPTGLPKVPNFKKVKGPTGEVVVAPLTAAHPPPPGLPGSAGVQPTPSPMQNGAALSSAPPKPKSKPKPKPKAPAATNGSAAKASAANGFAVKTPAAVGPDGTPLAAKPKPKRVRSATPKKPSAKTPTASNEGAADDADGLTSAPDADGGADGGVDADGEPLGAKPSKPKSSTPRVRSKTPSSNKANTDGKSKELKLLKPRHMVIVKYAQGMKKGLGQLLNALVTEEAAGLRARAVAATRDKARAENADRALERKALRDADREKQQAWALLQKKYPIDDDLVPLEPLLETPLPPRPGLRARLALHPDEQPLAPELLAVWDFVASFHKTLGIEPVEVDVLRSALAHTGTPLVLLAEVHLPLLALVLDEAGGVQAGGASLWRGVNGLSESEKNALPWPLALVPPKRSAAVADGDGQVDAMTAVEQLDGPPPLMRGFASVLALSPLGWPEALRTVLVALMRPPPPPYSLLGKALRSLGLVEYHELPFAEKLALLRALVDAAASTEGMLHITNFNAEFCFAKRQEHRVEMTALGKIAEEAEERLAKAAALVAKKKNEVPGSRKSRAGQRKSAAARRAAAAKAAGGKGGSGKKGAKAVVDDEDEEGEGVGEEGEEEGEEGEEGGAGGGVVEGGTKVLPLPPLPEMSDDESLDEGADAAAELAAEEKDEEAELSRTDRNRKKEKRDKVRREAQALRDARTRRRERLEDQARKRDEASVCLERAVTVPDVDSLEEALEKARACGMEWTDSDGNLCHTTQVRDALRAFKPLRQLEDLEEVGRKLEEGLADMPVRTVPLGEDAERRRYWVFPADFSRLYVEGDDVLGSIAQQQVPLGLTSPSSRPLAQARPWGYLESVQEVRELIASLDARGTRERDLKTRLRKYMGVFKQSMLAVPSFTLPTADAESTGADAGWTTDGPHVGARVLRTFDDVAQLATVVRYLPPDASANDPALWHLAHDDGDEEDFDEAELTPVLEAYALCQREPASAPLAYSITGYSNRFAKSRVTKSQLGLDGMRAEFSALEAVLAPALKKRGATWAHAHEADGSSPRKDWIEGFNAAEDASALGALLVSLEQLLRSTQTADDIDEDEGDEGMGDGTFRQSGDAHIGARLRRFFDGNISDATVDGWMPAGEGAYDPLAPLWHALHDDGDQEELEEWELLESKRALQTDAKVALTAAEKAECVAEAKANAEAAAKAKAAERKTLRAHAGERIWPTRAARERWIDAMLRVCTLAQVSIGLSSLLDHCTQAGVGSYSADLCRLSFMPIFDTGIDLQKKAAKTRSPSDMDLRFLCWQLPPRDALAEADAKASALRRKRGRNAGLPLTNSATVEAETLNRLRELFVPTNFMLHPPLVPAKPLKLEGGVAAALVAATFK